MRFFMKMMGIGELSRLALSSDAAVRAEARALLAELEHGSWKDVSELQFYYPQAEVDGARVTIHLGTTHCVELIFNYRSQMVLVASAGRRPSPSRSMRGKREK
jgi:hypothetical protein|tara:strand:- start:12065 stop:12373 length:309 start_codon:yes stop_codon:yes gene_type:complete